MNRKDLTPKEIIDELKGRIRNLRVSIMSDIPSRDHKKILQTRELALQSVLSWIVGQNQLREEERYKEREFELYGNSEKKERTTA